MPKGEDNWNITWLGNSLGYLYGTTYPGEEGNSVLTGHVTGYGGLPGPFFNLKNMKLGDEVTIHASGEVYHFVVREVRTVNEQDTSVIQPKTGRWVTLLTCKNYDIASDSYIDRLAVIAELVSVSD